MAAPAQEESKPGLAIPIVDLSLQLISKQNPPDGVVRAPAAACQHALLIDRGLSELLERKAYLSKGYLIDALALKDAACSQEDKDFLSRALLSYLDVVQRLEDAQDTQDVLRSHLSVASCHAAAGASIGSVDTLRHVVSLLTQLEDPSSDMEELDVRKLLDSLPPVQPDDGVEASLKALPEMAMLYRNLVEGAEARWRAKAEALEELGRCWRRHHSLEHGTATKKLVAVVTAAPPGAAAARGGGPMGGMAGLMGMGGMGGTGGPPAPTSKEELVDVEVDADLDLIRVIETSTIAKDLAAARHTAASEEADDGGLLSPLIYQDMNDERGLELLVYVRLVRVLTEYLKGDHEQGIAPLSDLAKLLQTGEYSSGKQSQLSPARLRELAQEALAEVMRAFRHVLHPNLPTSEELCKTLTTPLGILVTDPATFLVDFPAAVAAAAQTEQATANPAATPTLPPDVPAATESDAAATDGESSTHKLTAADAESDAAAAEAGDASEEAGAPATVSVAEATAAAAAESVVEGNEAEGRRGDPVKVSEAIAAAVGAPVFVPATKEPAEAVAEPAAEGSTESAADAEAKEEEAEKQDNEGEKEGSAPCPPAIRWSMEELISGSVLIDLELELRQYQRSPDATAWRLVLGLRAAALHLQHALEQQPVSVDSLAVATQAKEGEEFGVVRGFLLLEALRSFAADAAAEAGKANQATSLLLEMLSNYPHDKLGWTEAAVTPMQTEERVKILQRVYDELQALMEKITQVEGWALTGGYIAHLGNVLSRLLGEGPLYELPEGVYNAVAARVASLMEIQELECSQLSQLELWELLKALVNSESPLHSPLRGYLLAVLALDDADERSDALRELWGSLTTGEEVEVEAPAFDNDSPVKAFDPLDAALQLVSSVSMVLGAIQQLPRALQSMEVLVTALRKIQKSVLKVQPLFQTDEEYRLMEAAAAEADADRERNASLITDKDNFTKEVTGKVLALLHDPSSHPQPEQRLRSLLGMGVNLQEVGEGFGLLHMAVAGNQRGLLELLLQHGADANHRTLPLSPDISTLEQDKALLSPLDLAALHGHWQAVEVLIRHGASTSPDPETGLTPLHYAVAPPAQTLTPILLESKRVAVALLLKHRCPVNAAAQQGGATPLLLAAQYRLLPLAQALLKGKADVNKADKAGLTPLHHLLIGALEDADTAAETAKLLRLLLAHGAKTGKGPFMDDPALAVVDLAPHHWELPRSVQLLRSFGAPDAVLASVAAAPTSSLASLLYSSVVQRVAAVAGSRISRHTQDVWWHDREEAKNFRKRIKLLVANSFHVRLTPYRLALLNEKWALADMLRAATQGASRVRASLGGVDKSARLQVAVGDTLREATVLENQHGYQYLLTHEGENQARTNRRLQLAGLAPWVRQQGYLVVQPKVASWDSEAFDWSQCPDPDMRFQQELADTHDYKVGYTKRPQYSTKDANMVRVLDLKKLPDEASSIKSYGQALLHVLPAFGDQ